MDTNSNNNPVNQHEDRFQSREQRREARWQFRQERRAARSGSEWIVGIVLVLIGVVWYARTMNIVFIQNWWALFILIPALGSFATAWGMARTAGGHFGMRARSAFVFGLGLTLVTVMFLFNLNWTIFGPALLLLVGLGLLINGMLPK
jgi:hypothetical protein